MSANEAISSDGGDQGPMIVAIGWVFTAVAALTVGLWTYTRLKKRMALGWDIWLMGGALIARIIFQSFVTVMMTYGFGKLDANLTPQNMVLILKYTWISVPFAIMCSLLARFSITFLLIRLFGIHKWFKFFLIAMAALLVVISIAGLIITFAQVSPVQALWNVYLVPTRRWDSRVFLYSGYLLNAIYSFSDLIYVLLPVMIIWGLKMPLHKRLGLMFLMCLSLFTMSMSILKTIWVAAASHATKQGANIYRNNLNVLFTTLEQSFVIIMGCIPSIHGLISLDHMRQSMASLLTSGSRRTSAGSDKQCSSARSSEPQFHSTNEFRDDKVDVATSHTMSEGVTGISQLSDADKASEVDSSKIIRTDQWAITYTDDKRNVNELV